jgi:hypothetical protein
VYSARAGRHRVDVSGAPGAVALDVAGDTRVALDVHST